MVRGAEAGGGRVSNDDGIDHEGTNDITCPHCGAEDGDSWESNDRDGCTEQCGSCDKEFVLSVHHEVTYTTKKVSCEDQEPPKFHQWLEEIDHVVTTQEDLDRYKREGSILAKGQPHEFWIRTCAVCDENDYSKDAEPGGACVWKDAPADAGVAP